LCDPNGCAASDPDGHSNVGVPPDGTLPCNPDCLLPGAPVGALLGKFPGSGYFVVGSNYTFTRGGPLTLVYNDDYFPDNSGTYTATLQRGSGF
jgi:hypothetical protein